MKKCPLTLMKKTETMMKRLPMKKAKEINLKGMVRVRSSGGDTDQTGSNSRKRSRPDDGNGNDSQQPGRNRARSTSNHHEDECTLPHDLANSGSTTDLDSQQSINRKESMTMTDDKQMVWQRVFAGGNTVRPTTTKRN
eukprot:762231_1